MLDEAEFYFRQTLELNPDMLEAQYMLANMGKGNSPIRAPYSIILEHFESLAPVYEEQYIKAMDYKGVNELYDILHPMLNAKTGYALLDLGCGTGLCGKAFREHVNYMRGVDFSPAMMQHAYEKYSGVTKIYDNLIQADIYDYLPKEERNRYDIITLSGVCNYMGDLTLLFREAATILKPSGWLALTVELGEENDYEIMRNLGRYRHSKTYLKMLADTHGLESRQFSSIYLYHDFPGLVAIFRKPA